MEDKRIPARGEKDILKLAQKRRQVTQETIAGRIGVKRNDLNQNMNRSRMSLDTFIKVLNALDYDIVVVDRETGEPMWQLYVERNELLEDDI